MRATGFAFILFCLFFETLSDHEADPDPTHGFGANPKNKEGDKKWLK